MHSSSLTLSPDLGRDHYRLAGITGRRGRVCIRLPGVVVGRRDTACREPPRSPAHRMAPEPITMNFFTFALSAGVDTCLARAG